MNRNKLESPVRPDFMLLIRPATEPDRDLVWRIFHAVIAPGDTYALKPDLSREEAMEYWFRAENHVWVAEHAGVVVGTYLLRANQSGPGAHVANAGFMVAPSVRGHGVGRALGEHCLGEASRLGFRALQFNFVVSTNESALRLWHQLGFAIVGTLPGAFRHPAHGFVDAYVMYRSLAGA